MHSDRVFFFLNDGAFSMVLVKGFVTLIYSMHVCVYVLYRYMCACINTESVMT